jgi:hypothetical protein
LTLHSRLLRRAPSFDTDKFSILRNRLQERADQGIDQVGARDRGHVTGALHRRKGPIWARSPQDRPDLSGGQDANRIERQQRRPRQQGCPFLHARRDQRSASCLFTPPSKTLSTSSAISHPAARSASSERKPSGRGEPPPRPESELGLQIFARPNSVRVTRPHEHLIQMPTPLGEAAHMRYPLLPISAANIVPNRFHQNRIVSWLFRTGAPQRDLRHRAAAAG